MAKHILLPVPAFDLRGERGLKWKRKKKREGRNTEQTLNTSSSSRIRSSCREWLLGSTITFCIVPLSEGQKSTRLVSSNHTHAFNYRVKQIRLRSNEPLELWGISKSRTRLLVEKTPPAPPAVCLSLPMFAFELGMIAMTSFQKQNQLWQEWEWKLLRQVKDHKKGKMQLYPHQYGSFGLGIWAAEQGGGGGGGGYSNSSWKCLIRPSPPSLRQSAISGADMGTRHWLLFKNQGRRNRKERLLDKHRQLGERLPEQFAECQCSHVDNYKHECTRTSANKHTFFYYLNLVFLSTETHWHIFDKYSLHSKLLHNIACQLNQNCRTVLELHHFECLSYTSAAKLCRAYAANVSDWYCYQTLCFTY